MKTCQTKCVHSGTIYDSKTQGIISPLYMSSSCGYLDMEEDFYTRYSNLPNQRAVVKKMAALENTETGLVFSSGMGAISTTLLAHLKKGDHIIMQRNLFSVSNKYITNHLRKLGITSDSTINHEIEDFESLVQPHTKAIFFESPTNPLLSITDIKAVVDLAKKNNLLTFFDNTFATPINQNPISIGVDLVFHSATKYLGGHGDLAAGFVLGSQHLIAPIIELSSTIGGCLNSQICHLLERSLQTLAIRIEKTNENALAIAKFLEHHPKIRKVYYPGLPTHLKHDVAKKQMQDYGGLVSFELNEEIDSINFQKGLRIIRSAGSFGEIISTLKSPLLAAAPVADLSPERIKKIGLTPQTIRMSVGIEGIDDLIQDLDNALFFQSKNIYSL